MARTMDQIVQMTLGNQLMQIAGLKAENELLREQNAALRAQLAEQKAGA